MACVAAAFRPAASLPLIQIRKAYAAEWNGIAFRVASEPDCWTLEVRSKSNEQLLYRAERATLSAARASGAEFAAFQIGGMVAPALVWKDRW